MTRRGTAGLMRPVVSETTPATTAPENITTAVPVIDELWTDEDVMKLLKVNKQWLRDHTTRVEPILPHISLGREIRYPKSRLLHWLDSQVETRPSWERRPPAA
jgi:hypothetical protein